MDTNCFEKKKHKQTDNERQMNYTTDNNDMLVMEIIQNISEINTIHYFIICYYSLA